MLALAMVLVLAAPPKESPFRARVEALRALRNEGKHDQARAAGTKLLAELSTAAKEKTRTAETLVLLGRTQLYLKEDDAAALTLDEALTLEPDNVDAHFYRGVAAQNPDSSETAVKHFTRVTELAPKDARGWAELGHTLVAMRKDEPGIVALEKALAIDPKDASTLGLLGNVLIESNRGPEGIALMEKALTLRPNDTLFAYNAGQYYQNTGNAKLGVARFELVAKLEPDDWQARAKLVQLNQALGDVAARDRWRTEVIKLYRAKKLDARVTEFCREQFKAGGKSVLVYESFELTGERAVRYSFRVPAPTKGLERVISLGSYEFTTNSMREAGDLKADERAWHLDGYWPDNSHKTYGIFTKEPTYEATRAMVVDVLDGKLKASSGTSAK
jgi:cytochrome c-type biogenesis protein CcmH/NrfG